VEALEDRTLPALLTWIHSTGDDGPDARSCLTDHIHTFRDVDRIDTDVLADHDALWREVVGQFALWHSIEEHNDSRGTTANVPPTTPAGTSNRTTKTVAAADSTPTAEQFSSSLPAVTTEEGKAVAISAAVGDSTALSVVAVPTSAVAVKHGISTQDTAPAPDEAVTTSSAPHELAGSLLHASEGLSTAPTTVSSLSAAHPGSAAFAVLTLAEGRGVAAAQAGVAGARAEPANALGAGNGGAPGQVTPERGAPGAPADLDGLRDDLFAVTPLSLPEPELPAATDRLPTTDIAGALPGGRPRANLLPRGGPQPAGVAALVTGEAGTGGRAQQRSPLAALFINPLASDLLPAADDPAQAAATEDDEPGEDAGGGTGRVVVGVALTVAASAGALATVQLRRGRSCSPRRARV
jgi:hypothetical protein